MRQEPLSVGVIGCGMYGRAHAHACNSDLALRLKWVWSRTQAKCEQAAAEFKARAAVRWEEVIEDPDVDLVIIATPDFAHAQYAVAALDAGKHVFLEKPMATSVAECKQILDARDRSGKKLMVNYHNRWYPPAIAAREAVRSGRIGRPISATFVLSDSISWVLNNMRWGERSGPEWFLMSHIADLACWVLGERPSRVYATARKGLLASKGINTNDLVKAQLQMESGAIVDLESSWVLSERWRNRVNDMWFTVQGEEGRVDVVMDYENITITDRSGTETPFVYLSLCETPVLNDFAKAIVEDRSSPVSGEEAMLATRIVAAIVDSCRTGQPVDL